MAPAIFLAALLAAPTLGTHNPRCDLHVGCEGLTGNCCPNDNGVEMACCAHTLCNFYPACEALHLQGTCCPNEAGERLSCCDSPDNHFPVPVPAPPGPPGPVTPAEGGGTDAHGPLSAAVIGRLVLVENLFLVVKGTFFTLGECTGMTQPYLRKRGVNISPSITMFAGILELIIVALNFLGGVAGMLAGTPLHYVSQVMLALVMGGSLKAHLGENNDVGGPTLVIPIIFFAVSVVVASGTVGVAIAAGTCLAAFVIGYQVGRLFVRRVGGREIQPQEGYYIIS